MTCQCDVCKRLRRWRELGMSDDEMNYLCELEMDRDYYKAILSGEFPSSVEVLTRALEKAKQKQEKTNG